MLALVILAIDYTVYKLIFLVGFYLVAWPVLITFRSADAFRILLSEVWDIIIIAIVSLTPNEINVGFIEFWAGFAPSIWMWLYVLALFVTRGLLRSEKLVNWLRWALDIEKAPFRSIGAVAATLAFIVSVAIILVSAEVSRISTAS